jgi:hypothetical protein
MSVRTGPDRVARAAGVLLKTRVGVVGELNALGGSPGTEEGLASTTVSIACELLCTRTSTRIPRVADRKYFIPKPATNTGTLESAS